LWKSSFRATEHDVENRVGDGLRGGGGGRGGGREEEEKDEEEEEEEESLCGTAASSSAVSLTWDPDILKSACPACLERGAADAADVDCSIGT
jgi:hypothetical protein